MLKALSHLVQLRGFLDSFVSLAPAVKEANRAAAAAAAAVGSGAGQAPATGSGSAGPTAPSGAAGPSAAGPSAAAAAADDSDEDDLLVTDEKTADELYEVCSSTTSLFCRCASRHCCVVCQFTSQRSALSLLTLAPHEVPSCCEGLSLEEVRIDSVLNLLSRRCSDAPVRRQLSRRRSGRDSRSTSQNSPTQRTSRQPQLALSLRRTTMRAAVPVQAGVPPLQGQLPATSQW